MDRASKAKHDPFIRLKENIVVSDLEKFTICAEIHRIGRVKILKDIRKNREKGINFHSCWRPRSGHVGLETNLTSRER